MITIEGPTHSTNLTDGCWDCECETGYIHARIRESKCEKCGVTEEDGPDSHAHEAAEIESLRMTAKEAMEYVGMCPFCHHSEVDEDGDGECTCEACGKGWNTERQIVGYSWTDSAGNYDEETDEPEGRIKALEQERDRLRARVAEVEEENAERDAAHKADADLAASLHLENAGLRAEVERIVTSVLVDHARGVLPHRYEGACPDSVEGPDARDPECPVCRAIDSVSRLPALKPGEVVVDAAELAGLRAFADGWSAFRDQFDDIQYHYEGMGCGIEDRGIHDRYAACEYGWERAMERVAERFPEIDTLEAIRAQATTNEGGEG